MAVARKRAEESLTAILWRVEPGILKFANASMAAARRASDPATAASLCPAHAGKRQVPASFKASARRTTSFEAASRRIAASKLPVGFSLRTLKAAAKWGSN